MSAERFLVTIEVEVEGAEGGWVAEPIIHAARSCFDSPTPDSFRSLTIERKHAREVIEPEEGTRP